jgi:hypothetical protein
MRPSFVRGKLGLARDGEPLVDVAGQINPREAASLFYSP